MISAGACAYLMKHSSPDQIEAAIRAVHRKSIVTLHNEIIRDFATKQII
jgi:DNA-binding NarL/FixJ family response regulator